MQGSIVLGKGLLSGGTIVAKKLMTIGQPLEVKILCNLGYSRQIAIKAVERVPNLENAGGKPSELLMNQQLRMARQLQLERDKYLVARAARLRDEPHLGIKA